jgi:hypothetical protein
MATYRNKYMIMNNSEQADAYGNFYPDLATFPINNFIPENRGRPYVMDENDVYRFDQIIGLYYTSFNLYDDIILWLNDVPYLSDDDYIQFSMKFYQKRELDQFFINNLI